MSGKKLVIVSGLSGSGKSVALNTLEDLLAKVRWHGTAVNRQQNGRTFPFVAANRQRLGPKPSGHFAGRLRSNAIAAQPNGFGWSDIDPGDPNLDH